MESKFRLELLGITYNQIESGVYALILQQVGTNRRIPIIIGFPEAQAIECKLQDIKTPRPLTHDIMIETLKNFGITLKSVLIKRMPNGVFSADLHFTDGFKEIVVDSRSSDAVALAIRNGAPIFTTAEVLQEAGFDPEEVRKSKLRQEDQGQEQIENKDAEEIDLQSMTLQQLSDSMARAAENEDYEEAARIKAIIDQRNKDNNSQNS